MQITGGSLKSRKIDSPKGANVRPTLSQIRESIFSTLYSLIDFEEKNFLDAFAGSGIMGFEAVSRGFKSAAFIEKDKKTFYQIKSNAQKLGIEADFFAGDTLKILKKIDSNFDVIYVDPPYQSGLYDEVLATIKSRALLKTNGILILEHPKDLAINTDGFHTIKEKIYADKKLTYLASDF